MILKTDNININREKYFVWPLGGKVVVGIHMHQRTPNISVKNKNVVKQNVSETGNSSSCFAFETEISSSATGIIWHAQKKKNTSKLASTNCIGEAFTS